MAERSIVIVGGGLSSARVVSAYREAGGEDPIVLLSADSSVPYHRPPLSKRYLRGESQAEDAFVQPAAFYAEHDVELRLDTVVERLLPGDDALALADGERVESVAEEARRRGRRVLGDDPERARRADHERGPIWRQAADAEVRARTVAERREPRR